MKSVLELVSEEKVEELAIPSNFRLGKEIAAAGNVEIIESFPTFVQAKVKVKNSRKVELRSISGKLVFRCTCTSKENVFCKHCVAAALTI